MRRLSVALALVVSALVVVPVALADGGPLFVTQGGKGVVSHVNGLHYVAVSDRAHGTLLETSNAASGIFGWVRLHGSWGIPVIGNGYASGSGQGLSHDGRTLVLASLGGPYVSPSRFLVVDARRLKPLRTIVLDGTFSFDALSPDGSRMYLIQYKSTSDLNHYIVRAYDMRRNRLLPGKIADRSEDEKSMAGTALTRTTSAGGRWVYTLYQKPSGEPFIHALDTVHARAYCIDLPENRWLYNIALSMRDDGRTLAVHWRSGRPWLNVAVGSWRISRPARFPWAWVGAGIGGGAAVLSAGALLLRRRRREELHEHSGQELGLA